MGIKVGRLRPRDEIDLTAGRAVSLDGAERFDGRESTTPCVKCGRMRLVFNRYGPACRGCGHPMTETP